MHVFGRTGETHGMCSGARERHTACVRAHGSDTRHVFGRTGEDLGARTLQGNTALPRCISARTTLHRHGPQARTTGTDQARSRIDSARGRAKWCLKGKSTARRLQALAKIKLLTHYHGSLPHYRHQHTFVYIGGSGGYASPPAPPPLHTHTHTHTHTQTHHTYTCMHNTPVGWTERW